MLGNAYPNVATPSKIYPYMQAADFTWSGYFIAMTAIIGVTISVARDFILVSLLWYRRLTGTFLFNICRSYSAIIFFRLYSLLFDEMAFEEEELKRELENETIAKVGAKLKHKRIILAAECSRRLQFSTVPTDSCKHSVF